MSIAADSKTVYNNLLAAAQDRDCTCVDTWLHRRENGIH